MQTKRATEAISFPYKKHFENTANVDAKKYIPVSQTLIPNPLAFIAHLFNKGQKLNLSLI